jgi:tetratricopeptide (TPR) repeat protein
VDGYREALFSKFSIKSKVGLVMFAYKWGLVERDFEPTRPAHDSANSTRRPVTLSARWSGLLAGAFLATSALAAAPPPGATDGVPFDSLEHYSLGSFFEARGSLREAVEEYKLALKATPKDPEVHGSLARVYLELGEVDDAKKAALGALALDPDNRDALNVMVDVERGEKDLAGAIQTQRKLVAADSTDFEARVRLAELLDEHEELEAAVNELGEAARLKPGIARLHFRRAQLYARMGKLNEALAEYDIVRQLEPDFVDALVSSAAVREANRDLPGAEADYRGAIALDPTNLTARRRLLRVLLLADKADEAEKEARALLAISPNDLDVREQLGVLLLRTGRTDEAIVELKAVAKAAPDRLAVHRHLGRLYWDLKNPESAEREYEEAGGIDPQFVEGWVNLGYLRAEAGRTKEAAEALEIAAKLSPDNAVLHFLRGVCYNQMQSYEAAATAFTRSLELRPKNAEALHGLGVAQERRGKIDEAVAAFRELLTVAPDDTEAMNYLGYMLAEHEREIPEAVRLLERAVSLEPDNGYFQDSPAWALFKKGDAKKAREHLEKAMKIVPGDPVILEHYGDVLAALGEKERSREAYRKALLLDPQEKRLEAKVEGKTPIE